MKKKYIDLNEHILVPVELHRNGHLKHSTYIPSVYVGLLILILQSLLT